MKSLKSFIKSIEKTNKEFEAASKAEKRVMIAKDTIEKIKLNNLSAFKGQFIRNEFGSRNPFESFKDYTNENLCKVCAKGALFCSFVGRVNEVTLGEIRGGNSIDNLEHKKLLSIFTKIQLDLIETAFEGVSYLNICKNEDLLINAEAYLNKYPDNDKRLIVICENIIKNKGTFKP